MTPRYHTVVFDLGGVLIDWNPRHLYRKLFAGDEQAMERFLAEVCSQDWNAAQDAGRTWEEAEIERIAQFPDQAELIRAYRQRWAEMLNGAIGGSVAILQELKNQGTPVYALTNWSSATFPIALATFDFLTWFDGMVVSGDERLAKPDPAIFRLLGERFDLELARCVFIDDAAGNVAAADSLGMRGLRFTGAERLRQDLHELGLLARS